VSCTEKPEAVVVRPDAVQPVRLRSATVRPLTGSENVPVTVNGPVTGPAGAVRSTVGRVAS
jgi:hypothetical protein